MGLGFFVVHLLSCRMNFKRSYFFKILSQKKDWKRGDI